MKKFLGALTAIVVVLFSHPGFASDQAPDTLLRKISDDVLEIVRNDKALQAGDVSRAIELIETRVLPNFNFKRMTQLAVGRNWRLASAAQQTTLTAEFRTLLVRTYSKALTQYRDQTIVVKPLALQGNPTDVRVKTEVQQPGAKAITLDYFLEKVESGWKVYDIEVGGVSLVTNYRDSFATEVKNSGIDGLIASLKEKNQQGAPGTAKQ